MSTTETRFDLYTTVTHRIIELLEQGTIPWRKPWSSLGPPMNAISKRHYQGINLWMLLCLPYESNLYLTWDQLKRIGASVNKTEKGHMVVYWQVPEPKEENGEATDEQKLQKPLLRYHKVFNVEQCSRIPPSVLISSYEKQINPITICDNIVVNMKDRPQIKHGKGEAYYSISGDYINMPKMKSFESSEAYYSTLFHELVHSSGHESRVGRKSITEMAEFGGETYSIEELIAELGTCYLSSHAGILETEIKNSSAYIGGWLSKLQNDKRFVLIASTQAQKATDYILDIQKENKNDDAKPEVLIES